MIPKSYKGYKFIWKADDTGIFWAENVTVQRYFLKRAILTYEHNTMTAYASPEESKAAAEYGFGLFRDPWKIKKLLTDFYNVKIYFQDFERYLKSKNLRRLSNKELLEEYKKIIKAICCFVDVYRYSENHFSSLIEKRLRDYIAKCEKNAERQEEMLSKLLYAPLTEKGDKTKRNITKEQDHLERSLNLTPELLQIVNACRDVGVERFLTNQRVQKTLIHIDPLIQETSRRTFLAMSQLDALHFEELENLLLKNMMPNLKKVNERKEGFFIHIIRKGTTVYRDELAGQRALKEVKKLKKAVFGAVDRQVSGNVAFPGKARGIVRVFTNFPDHKKLGKEIQQMKEGEIIVASSTTPSLLPAIHKSSAIITDEGGVYSHAAIVAREFQKPCIVGTGNATEKLRTGMKVEVDAVNGVVVIL